MSVSAFILDTLHVMGGHVFWIIQPSRRPANTNDNNNNNNEVDEKGREICLHKNASCQTYVLQALKSYASIGIGLEIVKALFSNFSLICQDPTVGLMRSVKRINPKFLLFLAGYPTLYRVITVDNFPLLYSPVNVQPLSIPDDKLFAKSLCWRIESNDACSGSFHRWNAILFLCGRIVYSDTRLCIGTRIGMDTISALAR